MRLGFSISGPGLPALIMLIIAAISAILLASNENLTFRHSATINTLETVQPLRIWVFAPSHAKVLEPLASRASARLHRPVQVELIDNRALNTRLVGLIMADAKGNALPDLVEIQSGSIGRYFRVPAEQVPFMPLDHFLDRPMSSDLALPGDLFQALPWRQKLIPSRLAIWQRQSVSFGIPLDVHPVTLTYRKDLFDAAGVDLSGVHTWAQFLQAGQKYTQYWTQHGYPQRRAIALSSRSSEGLMILITQRRINLVAGDGTVLLTDPRVQQCLEAYLPMVAGPGAIAAEPSIAQDGWVQELASGRTGAVFTPDWRLDDMPPQGIGTAGTLAMIPLPVLDESDPPTSTWGGTAVLIPRQAADPELSWQLLTELYLSPQANAQRMASSQILPAMTPWDAGILDKPDPRFGNQPIGRLYATLAPQAPTRLQTPFTAIAEMQLARVLSQSVDATNDPDIGQLGTRLSSFLAAAQDDLQRRIAHGRLEQP